MIKNTERRNEAQVPESGMQEKEGYGFLGRFFPEPYENYPAAVKKHIMDTVSMFVMGGILLLVLLFAAGAGSYWYLGAVICAFGAGTAARTAFLAANGRLEETEGVVTGTERAGYRMQKNYLVVQTARGSVYRVILSDSKRKYREGNIVRFYTTPESLCHLKDGEYEVNVVYAMERVSAKVTSDEEDEKILAAENKKNKRNSE